MKLVIATRNRGKVREIAHIAQDCKLEYDILTLNDFIDMPEVEEDGNSFVDNAILKAKSASKFTNEICLADDSGLVVDILGGIPGVKSARFGGGNLSDTQRYKKLLGMIENVPEGSRTARFMCAVAIAFPNGEVIVSSGTCEGELAFLPRGENGFGYDPIFYIKELGKTLAELPEEEKNKISHRSKALTKAFKELNKKSWGS